MSGKGKEYSKNARAQKLLGRRLSKAQEKRGVIPFDHPYEFGYWCPTCKVEWDERLWWSEYAGFLWCPVCNFDWPSALCVRVDAVPDPKREWMNLGRDAAVKVFLDTVESALARKKARPTPQPGRRMKKRRKA